MSTSHGLKTALTGQTGRINQKDRTRRLLLDTAAKLLSGGASPTVSEVADAAQVSRRTAYRYFTSSKRLHADAALERLRPAMESAIEASASGTASGGIEARVRALVEHMQRLALENEPLLRTMIHETVLTSPGGAAQRRGMRRLDWIATALSPLKERLSAAEHKRLVCSLALCTGIEALMVLRDICGLSSSESTAISQWMCHAMVRQTLNELESSRRKRHARLKSSTRQT